MRHEDDIIRCLASRPEIRLAITFGSIAAGRETPDSDLDLAVAAIEPNVIASRISGRLARQRMISSS